ncbi:21.0 kDa GroEL-like chaperone [Spodoptera frugiperda ascovirus 1a]|uniref:21.0 kDa GroEL-like chaperone n=1 Tax=Spodoptera frugiperda ascovirus 1a TaxID=113370 RepID=Q0E583_SFAVA|nr:21.0 kDa GroEL-like chaperone [Spodoptera frugiperda ascovirus 1a]CAL44618.1 21.0 kDa GroEL-like chaperone [Spodoptera frugiperda ascovirus 1a]
MMFRRKNRSASASEGYGSTSSAMRREIGLMNGGTIVSPVKAPMSRNVMHDAYTRAWTVYCEADRRVTVNEDYFVLFDDKIAKRSFKSQRAWLKAQLKEIRAEYRNHYDETLYDTTVKYMVVDSTALQKVAMRHANNDALDAISERVTTLVRRTRNNDILDQVARKCSNSTPSGAFEGSRLFVY